MERNKTRRRSQENPIKVVKSREGKEQEKGILVQGYELTVDKHLVPRREIKCGEKNKQVINSTSLEIVQSTVEGRIDRKFVFGKKKNVYSPSQDLQQLADSVEMFRFVYKT